MSKKKLKVKRQRIRVSRRDWDQAQRMTDALLGDSPSAVFAEPGSLIGALHTAFPRPIAQLSLPEPDPHEQLFDEMEPKYRDDEDVPEDGR